MTVGQEKEVRGIQFRNKKVKLSLFMDDRIFYTENLKESTKKKKKKIVTNTESSYHGSAINESD